MSRKLKKCFTNWKPKKIDLLFSIFKNKNLKNLYFLTKRMVKFFFIFKPFRMYFKIKMLSALELKKTLMGEGFSVYRKILELVKGIFILKFFFHNLSSEQNFILNFLNHLLKFQNKKIVIGEREIRNVWLIKNNKNPEKKILIQKKNKNFFFQKFTYFSFAFYFFWILKFLKKKKNFFIFSRLLLLFKKKIDKFFKKKTFFSNFFFIIGHKIVQKTNPTYTHSSETRCSLFIQNISVFCLRLSWIIKKFFILPSRKIFKKKIKLFWFFFVHLLLEKITEESLIFHQFLLKKIFFFKKNFFSVFLSLSFSLDLIFSREFLIENIIEKKKYLSTTMMKWKFWNNSDKKKKIFFKRKKILFCDYFFILFIIYSKLSMNKISFSNVQFSKNKIVLFLKIITKIFLENKILGILSIFFFYRLIRFILKKSLLGFTIGLFFILDFSFIVFISISLNFDYPFLEIFHLGKELFLKFILKNLSIKKKFGNQISDSFLNKKISNFSFHEKSDEKNLEKDSNFRVLLESPKFDFKNIIKLSEILFNKNISFLCRIFFLQRIYMVIINEKKKIKLWFFSRTLYCLEMDLLKNFIRNNSNFFERNLSLKFFFSQRKEFQIFFFHSKKNLYSNFFPSYSFFYKKRPFFTSQIINSFLKKTDEKNKDFFLIKKKTSEKPCIKKNFIVFSNFFFRLNYKEKFSLKKLSNQTYLNYITKNFTFFLHNLVLKIQNLSLFSQKKEKKKKKIFWNQAKRLKIDILNKIDYKRYSK